MYLHMVIEGRSSVKLLTTNMAFIRLLPSMFEHVSFEVSALYETLATIIALVRLFPRVNALVSLQVDLLGEFATTERTFKFLLCMNFLMISEVAFVNKFLPTDEALKGCSCGVNF